MDIDQLRYFVKIADCGSFTRAAEILHISQSALSRSVQKLEATLGQPVFERQSRQLKLTPAGVTLQARAMQIIELIEDTRAQITDDGQSGRIRVGAIPTIAPYFLPALLQEFSAEFPDAVVSVVEDTTDHLLKACAQGEIDVGIMALPIEAKYLEIEELFSEELLLVVPRDHELASKAEVHLDDLEPYPFILLGETHCLADGIVTFCQRKSFYPVSIEQTNQLITVQELVSLGHGISMIPQMARRIDECDHRVYRSLVEPKPTRKVAAVWNSYRFQSKLCETFIQRLRSHCEK